MNHGFKQRAMEDRVTTSTMLLPRVLLTELGQHKTLSFHEEAPNYASSLAGTVARNGTVWRPLTALFLSLFALSVSYLSLNQSQEM
jgi:hypothetical protein